MVLVFVVLTRRRRPRCRRSCVRCRRADRHAVAGRGTKWANGPGAAVRVEVLGPLRLVVDGAAVEVPGPSAGRCSRCSRSPRAGPSASTTSWTRCGPPSCRTPGGRPCTPTSPGCVAPRPGGGPAADPTRRLPPRPRPANSTSRRRVACSRRPARTGGRAPPAGAGARAVARAGARRPHRRRADRDRRRGLRAAAPRGDRRAGRRGRRRGPGGRRRRARRRRARRRSVARAGGAAADARAGGDRAGRRGAAGRPRVPAPAGGRDGPRPVAGAGRAGTRHRGRGAPVRPTAPARRPGSSGGKRTSPRCTGCWRASGWSRSSGRAGSARPG